MIPVSQADSNICKADDSDICKADDSDICKADDSDICKAESCLSHRLSVLQEAISHTHI